MRDGISPRSRTQSLSPTYTLALPLQYNTRDPAYPSSTHCTPHSRTQRTQLCEANTQIPAQNGVWKWT